MSSRDVGSSLLEPLQIPGPNSTRVRSIFQLSQHLSNACWGSQLAYCEPHVPKFGPLGDFSNSSIAFMPCMVSHLMASESIGKLVFGCVGVNVIFLVCVFSSKCSPLIVCSPSSGATCVFCSCLWCLATGKSVCAFVQKIMGSFLRQSIGPTAKLCHDFSKDSFAQLPHPISHFPVLHLDASVFAVNWYLGVRLQRDGPASKPREGKCTGGFHSPKEFQSTWPIHTGNLYDLNRLQLLL